MGAADEASPITFDKDKSVIGPHCHASCSMIYCPAPLLGTNFPAKHVGCVFHEVLKWEVRVEMVRRASTSHFVRTRPRVYTTLLCTSGALFKEPVQSVPGIYNYNPDYALELQNNTLYVPYSKTAIDRRNLTAQMVGHLANLNLYGEIRHVSLTNPNTDNLSRPTDSQQFPKPHRENEDWLIMDSAKSDRCPIVHHESLSIKLEKSCPFSATCGKMRTDSKTITAHILLHHGEWALLGAQVRCPTCMEQFQIIAGPTGFSHHWETTHSGFEMFSNVENITGLGPRVKFGIAANIISMTAVAAATRITAAGGNSITIPERHYSKAAGDMLPHVVSSTSSRLTAPEESQPNQWKHPHWPSTTWTPDLGKCWANHQHRYSQGPLWIQAPLPLPRALLRVQSRFQNQDRRRPPNKHRRQVDRSFSSPSGQIPRGCWTSTSTRRRIS